MARQFLNTGFGDFHPPRTFKLEWFGDNTNRQDTTFARPLCDHRCRAGARSAAHARCDERHMRAVKCFIDALKRFFRGCFANFWLCARAQSTGDFNTQLNAVISAAFTKCLCVCICDDKINTLKMRHDHIIDGISTRAANTDHCNFRC